MSNTSATGGYLTPIDPQPTEGQDFDKFMQQVIVGITGLPGSLVRPLWQAEPPNTPDINVDWAAMGLLSQKLDTYAYINGDDLRRHELDTIRCSFYGPNANAMAARLADGLLISQNREVMVAVGVGIQEATEIIRTAEMVKQVWRPRFDINIILRRQVRRSYPVLTILVADGLLYTDTTPQIVVPFTA